MTAALAIRKPLNLELDNYTFRGVDRFVYLGTELNEENKNSQEINRRIRPRNRAYYANLNLLKSKLLSRKIKMKIYKSLIRPVAVSYTHLDVYKRQVQLIKFPTS